MKIRNKSNKDLALKARRMSVVKEQPRTYSKYDESDEEDDSD